MLIAQLSLVTFAAFGLVLAGCHRDASVLQGAANGVTSKEVEVRTIAVNKEGVHLLSVKASNTPERIRIQNGSVDVLVLPQNSQRIHDETKSGAWLVYIWAPWNSHEAAELMVVAEAAESLRGTAKVAARTYTDYSDIPDFQLTPHTSPRWVVLFDGKVLGELSGYLGRDQVVTFVRTTIANNAAEKK